MGFTFRRFQTLPDVMLVQPPVYEDPRGWFMETYKRTPFIDGGISDGFVQDGTSRSLGKGIVRGLHFQKAPHAQGKLVRATRGEIFDVAVDIRRGSPTFGSWVSTLLTETNKHALWVPPGFAHGFCTLTEETEVVYKMTAEYSPEHDRSIRWNDPRIGIAWPVAEPLALSRKDAAALDLDAVDINFDYVEGA